MCPPQLKTSRLLGNVYKGLGVVSLKLNVLMQDLLTETSKNVAYPMVRFVVVSHIDMVSLTSHLSSFRRS